MKALAVKSTWGASLERRLVRRSRLLDAIEKSSRRTVLLVAPAGYGKTTLARQWLEGAGGAWVGLGSGSADVPVLARELGKALAELIGVDEGRVESALSAGKTPNEQAQAVAHTILAQIQAPLEGWLVVDDYQVLAPNPAAEELVGLLERSGRFNIIVTSRDLPIWATSRRRVHLEMLELGPVDLALDDSEASELLPRTEQAAALMQQSRGWPAVIGLAAHVGVSSLPSSADSLSASLYDYLAEELYDHTTPEVRHLLTAIAVFPSLGTNELDDVMGVPEAAGRVIATGLAYEVDARVEIHPLAREFLRSKLVVDDRAAQVIQSAFELMLVKSRYDDAFELIRDFELDDRLELLITNAYAPLVETGRIATLESFGIYAEAHGSVSQRLTDLIAAEVALRDGAFDYAFSSGQAAGAALPVGHPLKARCYLIAGSAAHLMSRFEDALRLHSEAAGCAVSLSDRNDAAWGKCIAALLAEDMRAQTFLRELESLESPRPSDRARTAAARIRFNLLAEGGGLRALAQGRRSDVVSGVTDPWVRSSWSGCYGYALILQGCYEEARVLLQAALSELRDFRLWFGTPHVELLLAASELGSRHFGRADAHIRRVERGAAYPRDLFLQLNVRALRARLCLAQSRPEDALALTSDDFDLYGSRAMYGEYLATRSLALAVVGRNSEALQTAGQAEAITRSTDSRIICSAVRIIAGGHSSVSEVATLLDEASSSGVWDGLVSCMRASPVLLEQFSHEARHRAEIRDVLIRSNDVALAKAVGLATRATGPRGVLSPREREVLDQVRQGRKNSEIAATLFISPGTVKRHMDHVFDKLGVRTRAAAVARYAEIETTVAGSASTDAS